MYECIVPSTKLMRTVLATMKENNYVKDFEEFKEGKFKTIKITLSKKINDIGVIKPRYPVTLSDDTRSTRQDTYQARTSEYS